MSWDGDPKHTALKNLPEITAKERLVPFPASATPASGTEDGNQLRTQGRSSVRSPYKPASLEVEGSGVFSQIVFLEKRGMRLSLKA